MKIWVISDTHRQHNTLVLPDPLPECIIHCGDSANAFGGIQAEDEFNEFIEWFSALEIKHKILIAGNHDAWALKKYNRDRVKDLNMTYLEHEYHELNGNLIFGSPYTPTFGTWHFMKDRSKIGRYWEALDESINILITHGPPKGILDLSHDRNHVLEYCGDSALKNMVFKIQPKYHLFGHIHNSDGCMNQGIRIIDDITFINASCVTDGRFNFGCTSNGLIIDI